MSSVAVVGGGVVGERVRRNLAGSHHVVPRDLIAEIVVLTSPGPHAAAAAELLARGTHVVSTSGASDDVRELLDLDAVARRLRGDTGRRGRSVARAVRAAGRHARRPAGGMRRAARRRARDGRAGLRPRASPGARRMGGRMARRAVDRTSSRKRPRAVLVSGAGRSPRLLPRRPRRPTAAAPQLSRPSRGISARRSATRRDRLTARLPMLSPPHLEGGIGAVRVEARGRDDGGARVTHVIGVAELIGTAAAATAAAMVDAARHGAAARWRDDDLRPRSAGGGGPRATCCATASGCRSSPASRRRVRFVARLRSTEHGSRSRQTMCRLRRRRSRQRSGVACVVQALDDGVDRRARGRQAARAAPRPSRRRRASSERRRSPWRGTRCPSSCGRRPPGRSPIARGREPPDGSGRGGSTAPRTKPAATARA